MIFLKCLLSFFFDIIGIGSFYMLLGMLLAWIGLEKDYLDIYIEFGLYAVILLCIFIFVFRANRMLSKL